MGNKGSSNNGKPFEGDESLKELMITANALYESAPKQFKDAANELYKKMDKNGDGHVDLSEFLHLLDENKVLIFRKREFFKIIDKNGDGKLDVDEVRTLFYIMFSGRPFCSRCLHFISGIYFCCSKCDISKYALCVKCFSTKAYVTHTHYGDKDVLFLDTYSLANVIRNPPNLDVNRAQLLAQSFRWKIENFSRFRLEERVRSTGEFMADGYKWEVHVYSIGLNNDRECFSMYLRLVDSDDDTLPDGCNIYANYYLAIVNHLYPNDTAKCVLQNEFKRGEISYGYESFPSFNELQDPTKGYLVNDTIMIEANVKIHKVTFTWRIENFSRLDEDEMCSKVFIVDGYKWKVSVYPKGNKNNAERYLSMYLYVANSDTLPYGWSIDAEFSLVVVNQINSNNRIKIEGLSQHKQRIKRAIKKCDARTNLATLVTEELNRQHTFTQEATRKGNGSFMRLNKLQDPNKGYLVNDTLVVEANVKTNMNNVYTNATTLEEENRRIAAAGIQTIANVTSIASNVTQIATGCTIM